MEVAVGRGGNKVQKQMINAQLENISRHLSTGWAWVTSCLTEKEWMTVRKRKSTFISLAMVNTWLPL